MIRPALSWLFLAASLLQSARAADQAPPASAPTLLVVVGAAGEPEYADEFRRQADLWGKAVESARARLLRLGDNPPDAASDLDRLQQTLALEATNDVSPLWLVLIGHGTFDGKEARYNLRGPDFTASELAAWLKPCARPLILIDSTASSAPFVASLAATNRIVISATRSGRSMLSTALALRATMIGSARIVSPTAMPGSVNNSPNSPSGPRFVKKA